MFCDACRLFMDGLSPPEKFHRENPTSFVHHPTTDSFQQALELPCPICQRLWKELSRIAEYTTGEALQLGPTSYSPWTYFPDNGHAKFSFTCERLQAYMVLEPIRLESKFHQDVLPTYTGSEQALDFLAAEYEDCIANHSQCRSIRPVSLPTRVLDVGDATGARVRLRDGQQIGEEQVYAVLSHCWGRHQPLILTSQTAPRMREGITLKDLPKTFQDAITVTRRLNMRYIWIDSLCIFQDNLDDWAVEAARMRDVYSNATICIAATSARDGTVGLFFERDPAALLPIEVKARWDQVKSQIQFPPSATYRCGFHWNASYSAVDAAPLNQRAWVAQERYLSSRILHFAKDVLFWECRESLSNELFRGGLADFRYGVTKYTGDARTLKRLARQSLAASQGTNASLKQLTQDMYRAWDEFRTLYTTYNMTKESDVLIALLGVAQDVAEATNDDLVQGLWKGNMLAELCWMSSGKSGKRPDRSQRPLPWRAPSWSWASTTFQIYPSTFFYGSDFVDECAMCSIEEIRATSAHQGQAIILQCRPMSATIRQHTSVADGLRRQVDFTGTPQEKRYAGTQLDLYLDDYDPAVTADHTSHVHVVAVRTYRSKRGGGGRYLDCIALVPVSNDITCTDSVPPTESATQTLPQADAKSRGKRKTLSRMLRFGSRKSWNEAGRNDNSSPLDRPHQPHIYKRVGVVLASTENSVAIALQRHREAECRVIEII